MRKSIGISILSSNEKFHRKMESRIKLWEEFALIPSIKNPSPDSDKLPGMEKSDIVLVDLDFEKNWELKKIKLLSGVYPNLNVVGVSADFRHALMFRYIQSGVRGFIHFNSSHEEFRKGLLFVKSRGFHYSAEAALALTEQLLSPNFETALNTEDDLNHKEVQTLELICKGFDNRTISYNLGVSPRTVERYKDSIRKKMDATSLINAAFKAIEYGIIGPGR